MAPPPPPPGDAAVGGDESIGEPVVFDRAGAVYTNSQHVAAYFGKRHDNVLRDVDAILAHSSDLRDVFFKEVSEDHPTVVGRKIRSFDLTKDGFTLLVMGYIGPKAMPFKLAYIARFNAMEAELRARAAAPVAIPDFSDPAVLLAHLMEQTRGRAEDQRRAAAAETRAAEVGAQLAQAVTYAEVIPAAAAKASSPHWFRLLPASCAARAARAWTSGLTRNITLPEYGFSACFPARPHDAT